jgi:hypothetical protein
MPREIANYQDLQDAVADYLNRTDLTERIPTFIYFGERKIFRWFRQQANEQLQTIDMRLNPDPLDPNQVLLSERIDLPDDYLDTLTLQANGKVLRRISLTELQVRRGRRNNGSAQQVGEPAVFARQRDSLILNPAPDGDTFVTWIYYCDLSGRFDDPADDNSVLRIAPDLYVYAALLEAEPFLKPEDAAFGRIPIWKSMYEEGKQALIDQNEMEAVSGSTNEVESGFTSGYGRGPGPFDREGWA